MKGKTWCPEGQGCFSILESTVQSLFKTSPFKFICWHSSRVLFPPSKVSTRANFRRQKWNNSQANLLEKAKKWALKYCLYSCLFKKAKFFFQLSEPGFVLRQRPPGRDFRWERPFLLTVTSKHTRHTEESSRRRADTRGSGLPVGASLRQWG